MALMPKATAMMGVPTFYTRLLDDPALTRAATAHMRVFISGSAPLLAETHDAWAARTGHRILERYGMTETNMNTSNPYDGERRAGTVGFPPAGGGAAHPDRRPRAAPEEVGMIEVRGPNVFSGYWQMPDKTREELRPDGWFITGDLGKRDADGYVHIVGRAKDLVITGGYNVYPKEVELLLDEVPGVLESAVIGLPHPDFGEAVLPSSSRRRARRWTRRRCWPPSRGVWQSSSSRRARSWWTACRATPWARCRRTSCATHTARASAASGRTAAAWLRHSVDVVSR